MNNMRAAHMRESFYGTKRERLVIAFRFKWIKSEGWRNCTVAPKPHSIIYPSSSLPFSTSLLHVCSSFSNPVYKISAVLESTPNYLPIFIHEHAFSRTISNNPRSNFQGEQRIPDFWVKYPPRLLFFYFQFKQTVVWFLGFLQFER